MTWNWHGASQPRPTPLGASQLRPTPLGGAVDFFIVPLIGPIWSAGRGAAAPAPAQRQLHCLHLQHQHCLHLSHLHCLHLQHLHCLHLQHLQRCIYMSYYTYGKAICSQQIIWVTTVHRVSYLLAAEHLSNYSIYEWAVCWQQNIWVTTLHMSELYRMSAATLSMFNVIIPQTFKKMKV